MTGRRRVSEPVELARIEGLVDRGVRVPRAYLAVARVHTDRGQTRLCVFDERRDGRIVVDLDGLRREHPGEVVRFQLRESGQVLGTAQWHIPDRAPSPTEGVAEQAMIGEVVTGEVQRLRKELAELRGEARVLAEEVRRLRDELGREQAARHRAEAERDIARQEERRLRAAVDRLRERVHEAELERKESELAFRLLREEVPEVMEEVHRLVTGGVG